MLTVVHRAASETDFNLIINLISMEPFREMQSSRQVIKG